jgi:hypothetical protein
MNAKGAEDFYGALRSVDGEPFTCRNLCIQEAGLKH